MNAAVVAKKEKRLQAFVIFVSDVGKKLEPQLTALADRCKAGDIALAYISTKDDGVRDYKINLDPTVRNTVMLYRRKTVASKFVNLAADEKGIGQLKAGIDELTK